jgi:tetratricopeptide (TPR) repeat protein/tRNA A-37 threonylcarbamoyl transferase component Bud32
VKRRVALKLIRAGLGSDRIIARFEAERQALALMDHTNIAKVLDAGTTESGRPYFVMELIKGVPITTYCDELNLPVRERLELFVPVCRAVQHAHQKGIIHRDIKPSNVLVAVQDGKPVPKVIDFGVAKATGQKLTERSMATEFGALVGTLEYMSPEQAELSELDIDTRADVYALGVLLYELLTGTPPLDREEMKTAAIFEVLRKIRQDEPPKPSTRLSSSVELPSLAAQRRTEPARLKREVKGELDWIVMRCLEKDRQRRYETADALARDVERHLADEPVEAGPPSARYRLKKWARRNRITIVVAATIWCSTLVMMGLVWLQGNAAQDAYKRAAAGERAAWEAKVKAEQAKQAEAAERAKAEKQKEIAEAVKEFLEHDLIAQVDVLADAALGGKPDPNLTLTAALDRAAANIPNRFGGQPLIEASVRRAIGNAYEHRGLSRQAQTHLERACELLRAEVARPRSKESDDLAPYEYVAALIELANVYISQGQNQKALATTRTAQEVAHRELAHDEDAQPVLDAVASMQKILAGGDPAQAIEETKTMIRRLAGGVAKGPVAGETPGMKAGRERLEAADRGLKAVTEKTAAVLDALKLVAEHNYPDAERALTKLIAEARVEKENDKALVLMSTLGDVYRLQGKNVEALKTFETARAGLEKSLGGEHPAVAACRFGVGQVLLAEKKFDLAEPELRAALAQFDRQFPDHYLAFEVKTALGEALAGRKKYPEAEPLLKQGYEGLKARTAEIPGNEMERIMTDALTRLVKLYDEWGKKDEAAKWRAELEALKKK